MLRGWMVLPSSEPQAAGTVNPSTPRSSTTEEYMLCPNCNVEMNLRKAGMSKAGKPYPAFFSCPVRECGYTQDAAPAAPPARAVAPKPAAGPQAAPAGNLRLQAACASIQAACMLRSGTQMPIDQVMNDAATIYYQFIRPTQTGGEVPEAFERGPDSDIPF